MRVLYDSLRIAAVTVVVAMMAIIIVGCGAGQEATPTPRPEFSLRENYVSATGRVVPTERAELAFAIGGVVDEVLVAEGDAVQKGEVLAVLRSPELQSAPAQARAALALADAQLAQAEAGPRDVDVEVARIAVDIARQSLASSREAVAVARAQELSAASAVSVAQASLDAVLAGPTAQEVQIAREQVQQAKSLLYASQGQRDAVGGSKGSPGYESGAYDAAQGQVYANEDAVQIAELRLSDLLGRPRGTDVEAAKAQVAQAEAGVEVARAQRLAAEQSVLVAEQQVRQAQAQLAVAQTGPRDVDTAVAQAAVDQGVVSIESTEASLTKTILRAPLAGAVASMDLRVGEYAQPGVPAVAVGDLTTLQVETTDLDEIDIARVSLGAPVRITFDSLPNVELEGQVTHIALKSSAGSGGTTYETHISLPKPDPRLRWGMTAFVDIQVE